MGSQKLQISWKLFREYKSEIQFHRTEDIFTILDQKVNLAIVLTSTKRYLVLTMFLPQLIFWRRHFLELAPN